MYLIGFIMFSIIFSAILTAIFGPAGGATGAVLGGLFIICAQLGEIKDLLEKSQNTAGEIRNE